MPEDYKIMWAYTAFCKMHPIAKRSTHNLMCFAMEYLMNIDWTAINLRSISVRRSDELNTFTQVFFDTHVVKKKMGWLVWHQKLHVGISLMIETNMLNWNSINDNAKIFIPQESDNGTGT